MSENLMDASSRVALAAYLHDLGKFAERGRLFANHPDLDAHLLLYCPYHEEGRWFSHRHAAHTALALDALQPHLPDLVAGDVAPFVGRRAAGQDASVNVTDSLVNASAAHHKPSSFLQWIVATADRVASGFERDEFDAYNRASEKRDGGLNHFTSRQLTLFEQIGTQATQENMLRYRYPLRRLSPRNIFPVEATACEFRDDKRAQQEYAELWRGFCEDIARIPSSHKANLPLWLDHFDSLWLSCTHAIPAATAFGVKPEVSLYDHSRTTAALAVALWRWHHATGATDDAAASRLARREDFGEQKFLLVQGDFFGIQDFIFSSGGDNRKHLAKLLRGRSFQISLFTEMAALRILDVLALPPTSVVTNAAGKFLLVAPNTEDVRSRLAELRAEMDAWFLDHAFGMAGIGLAWTSASASDFLRKTSSSGGTPFQNLMKTLRAALERAKYQRFALCERGGRVYTDVDFPHGVCSYNDRWPADDSKEGIRSSALSRDQIKIGESLLALDRLLVVTADARSELRQGAELRVLETNLFGYTLAFTGSEASTGKFGQLAHQRQLRRCWDFSLPTTGEAEQTQWNGLARRFISGYVPRVSPSDRSPIGQGKYAAIVSDELPHAGDLKTLDRWRGVAALGVLKGDIDNLGQIFGLGLQQPTFAKMAALSRQVSSFFTLYLPWLLAKEFPEIYTVFAGGDDFFLIGSWRNVQKLAHRLKGEFASYVARNSTIHFSAGIATQKPGAPISALAELAEEALDAAKRHNGKNAVSCFGETVAWHNWDKIEQGLTNLNELSDDARLSRGFVYSLQELVALHAREQAGEPQGAMWRARLAYRAKRFVNDSSKKGAEDDERAKRTAELRTRIGGAGIEALGTAYRIVLFNHLYRLRDR